MYAAGHSPGNIICLGSSKISPLAKVSSWKCRTKKCTKTELLNNQGQCISLDQELKNHRPPRLPAFANPQFQLLHHHQGSQAPMSCRAPPPPQQPTSITFKAHSHTPTHPRVPGVTHHLNGMCPALGIVEAHCLNHHIRTTPRFIGSHLTAKHQSHTSLFSSSPAYQSLTLLM
jgi:hypothetical protein